MRGFFNYDTRGTSRVSVQIHHLARFDFSRWNRAMAGAFRKGAAACLAGESITACPYQDKRKPNGRLSWSRAFISAWEDGWRWSYKLHTGEDFQWK